MSDRVLINADLKFVEGVMKAGGEDLNKCYQCSTCTVVCPLTPEGAPFPRKEMIAAQWGIKDKLIKSMDPWLCFHCNDCSEQCPRGAKPGDVMAAIRNMIIANVAVPSFLGKLTQSAGGALGLLLFPIILIAAVIFMVNGGEMAFLDNPVIDFHKNMISQLAIEMIYIPALFFGIITGLLGVKNLIAGLSETYPKTDKGEALVPAIIGTVKDILSHKKFRECGVNQSRNIAHMFLFYAFIGLAITTAGVTGIYYINLFAGSNVVTPTPLPFFHPIKIIGNVSALAASIGILLIVYRRLTAENVGNTVAFDWIFIVNILLIVATGILAQTVRVAGSQASYFIYYCHLVLVFYLFMYMPHSKFGHMFYRTAALVYSRYSGREKSIGMTFLEGKQQEQLEESDKVA
ncbi:MAG: quinone-interacting membrane-bound oxidoreductase complex subunit QmoC [Deltaproteobacteria bacterium]|jgi:quinone-modifying oxidoreductase subunit QmoC|nr:quinone-interacting membrane-bound oxidoreductase complex subunit QmoC [Deltaproteobacteria bacterium]MBT4087353.1 quinone-interacting membrane-bound oxidoreductase complex subunit QmoC [Deltaproteobacteria bacterium]MBT4266983.1 quinone-interacting membrane-bound oxidoreductase complex subunit QmoC [Deltaproteobacteria bacterium]MBT4639704.1 quinone-interacting membrane-bound oxidoreductase complex subunit QmoC [Deltaproteobacteria bacterium]MBT6504169.1 quinone-interacting membrane-bound o